MTTNHHIIKKLCTKLNSTLIPNRGNKPYMIHDRYTDPAVQKIFQSLLGKKMKKKKG